VTLLALQRDFGAWLRSGSAAVAARFAASCAPGLRVYQNNYRAQLVTCLETTFVRTREWIGEEAFHNAMVTHIDGIPPSSWTLDDYGRDFSMALSTLFPDDLEVTELAWLEWALGEAFTAADHAALDRTVVADTDWDNAALRLSPSIDILALTTNAPAIWSALSESEMPPPAEMLEAPAALLVWRKAMTSHFRIIDARERDMLLLAKAGRTFAFLCEKLVAEIGEQEGVALAGELLGRWIADDLIAEIYPA
jgi:hypothetical protein